MYVCIELKNVVKAQGHSMMLGIEGCEYFETKNVPIVLLDFEPVLRKHVWIQ
jgi:hypothetical protein